MKDINSLQQKDPWNTVENNPDSHVRWPPYFSGPGGVPEPGTRLINSRLNIIWGLCTKGEPSSHIKWQGGEKVCSFLKMGEQ